MYRTTGLKSGLFDEVMVSTNDKKLASIARQYGASVPFLRSAETANDFATTADVLNEVLENYSEQGIVFDNMCCLYATAPLVSINSLKEAYKRICIGTYRAVYPVVAFSYPIWRCLDLSKEGILSNHWPEYSKTRTQDLSKEYHDSGTFY